MPLDMIRDGALLSMTTPLGKDVLIPVAVRAEEMLDAPFRCTVEAVSTCGQVNPDDLLHQQACVLIKQTECPARAIHGLVRRFAASGPLPRGFFGYRLEIVPALWFLGQTQDCRIFENESSKKIVGTILREHGIKFNLRVGDTDPRPLTVQHNETDLNFISRLIRQEGWFYLFKHEPNGHTLIITESNTSFTKVPDGPVTLYPGQGLNALSAWHPGRETACGKVMMADFDPEKPSAGLSGDTSTTACTAGAALRDPFHWPAHATSSDQISQRTRQRIESAEAAAALSDGAGFNPNFFAGGRIMAASQPNTPAKEYILHGVTHDATDISWTNAGEPPRYTNTFRAFPSELPWRPVPTAPWPRMEGLHSAEVIGPEGEEIHTDEIGRIKLRFRWDRRKDASANGIWVRVMQAWSGASAGWCFIPRVGTEVAVSFLDGDPDRPVVVGQLHNGDQHPPWSLPAQKTRGGLRTRSTPNGGEQNCSEFYFDDKKGSELVFLHAERDMTVEVENDLSQAITNNRKATIAQGNDTVTVQQGDRLVDVPMGNHTIKSNQGDISVKTDAGNITLKTALGAISIEAMQSITLKVGESTVTLDQAGVSIKGMQVQVEGQVMTSVKAPVVQINADGLLKAAGGIVMLN